MSKTFLPLTKQIHDYLITVSSRESALLQRLRKETAHLPMARMQISPVQGQFLSLLIQLLNAKKTIEIGVFTGYSSLCTALALPADGKLIACDMSEEWTEVARRYWSEAGVDQKITLRLAPAIETLNQLLADNQAGTFDFAFIDADKANYDAYYESALKLLRIGGLIVVDNVLWSGRVADLSQQDEDTVAIRALNEKLHRDERITLSMLSVGDGLTLALKRG